MNDRSPNQSGNLSTQEGAAAPLKLDPDEYREHLEEFDLSREQEDELLEALWNILRTFVDIGFGLDSVQLFVSPEDEKASGIDGKLLEKKDVENTDGRKQEGNSDE